MIDLHRENTIYNTVLSKAYQKGQRGRVRADLYYGGEVFVLEPDEVIEKLKELGISISRKTLYNWEKWGLIPEAIFRNSRTTIYPDHTWAEAFASYHLMRDRVQWVIRLTAEAVAQLRAAALRVEKDPALLKEFIMPADIWVEDDGGDVLMVDAVCYKTPSGLDIPGGGEYMAAWLSRRAEAEAGVLMPGQVQTIYSILDGKVRRELRITDQGGLRIV